MIEIYSLNQYCPMLVFRINWQFRTEDDIIRKQMQKGTDDAIHISG
jgi:hypothetical protein